MGNKNIPQLNRKQLYHARRAMGLLFQSGALGCLDAADINDDGAINIADPIFLLAYIFSGGPAPSPPSACGADPTADAIDCVASGCP